MSWRLSDDVVLRQSAASAELLSRTTEHAIPLDDEQAAVVALLENGATTTDELTARARRRGVAWDRATMEAFVERLEGWGLLERNGVNPTSAPQGLANEATVDIDDADTNQSYADDDDDTQQAFIDADITEITDHPLLHAVADTEVVTADAIEAALAADEALRKTEELVVQPDMVPPTLPEVQVRPRRRLRTDDDATIERRPTVKSLKMLRVDRVDRGVAPGVEPAPPRPVPTGPHLPTTPPPGRPSAQAVSLLQGPSKVPPPPPSQAKPRSQKAPYPRLLPNWIPKLLPNSRHILFVDPARGEERKLQSWEYQVARRLDGQRSPEEVANWAQSIGLQLQLEDVHGIIDRLVRDGVLEAQPSAVGRPTRRTPGASVVRRRMEAAAGWQPEPNQGPFTSEPDSIMEGLAGLSKPGSRRHSPDDAPEPPTSERKVAPPVHAPDPLASPHLLDEALTRAAALVETQKNEEAKNILQSVVDLNPGVVQAVAMLKLLEGTVETPHLSFTKRYRTAIIAASLGGLLGLLLLGFVIKVDDRVTLPCQTTLLGVKKIASSVSGQIRAVMVSKESVVRKGQQLASVSDNGQRAELRRQIADKKDLLRIMKTKGGTTADERKQKRLLATLRPELARTKRDCKSAQCKARIKSLTAQIESAKKKQHYFEWQAEKKEIRATQSELSELKKKARQLSRISLEIISPAAGRIISLQLAKGRTVSRGETVATICNAERLQVIAHSDDKPTANATVTLRHNNSKHTHEATKVTRRGANLLFEIESKPPAPPKGSCTVEFLAGRISLLTAIF